MVEIRLEAKDKSEARVKAYLEENASETLVQKINFGAVIEKDGKQVLNVKTLSGFMKWACEEAKKQAAKGACSACVDDATVFGWAIHYFEEDSIEETLYNDDGTEYKPQKSIKKQTVVAATPKPMVKKCEDSSQQSIFDLSGDEEEKSEVEVDDDADAEEEVSDEDIELGDKDTEYDIEREKTKVSPLYTGYMAVQNKYPDAVIAKRIGDFYEVFGESARILSGELELTLAGRDCGLSERVPMIGFPYHRAEEYFGRVRKLHTLVISEDGGETVLEKYIPVSDTLVDGKTGEVVEGTPSKQDFWDLVHRSFDEEYLNDLFVRLDNDIDIY